MPSVGASCFSTLLVTHQLAMMRTSILLPFCIALLYPIIALANEYTFDLDIVLPDKNNKDHNYYKDLIHDPARTYLSIYSIENDVEEDNKNITDSINFKFINNFHSDKDGVYHIKLPDAGKYQMIFQSLDLFFASSSQFQLTITDNINENENETEIIIQQFLPGLHKTLQEKLPYIKTTNMETPIIINGAQFHIGIKQYLQQDVGGLVTSLINTIPFLGTIMNNRWLKITAISMIVMAVLPFLLTRLDPEFADRLVEQQVEAASAAKENENEKKET